MQRAVSFGVRRNSCHHSSWPYPGRTSCSRTDPPRYKGCCRRIAVQRQLEFPIATTIISGKLNPKIRRIDPMSFDYKRTPRGAPVLLQSSFSFQLSAVSAVGGPSPASIPAAPLMAVHSPVGGPRLQREQLIRRSWAVHRPVGGPTPCVDVASHLLGPSTGSTATEPAHAGSPVVVSVAVGSAAVSSSPLPRWRVTAAEVR